MLLCYLRHNVEASCQTLYRRLPPSTNTAAYQRLARHGPLQLSVLQLAFTARDLCLPISPQKVLLSPSGLLRTESALSARQMKSAAQNSENNWKYSCFRRTAAHCDFFDYCALWILLLTYLLTLPAFDTPIRGRGSRRNLTVPSVNYPISEVIFTQVILCSTLV